MIFKYRLSVTVHIYLMVSQYNGQFFEWISGVKAPIAVLGAEIDKMSPPELLKQFEEVLAAKPEVGRSSVFFCLFFSFILFFIFISCLHFSVQVILFYMLLFSNREIFLFLC